MEQGIYDISNEDYHSSLGLSSSGISLLKECPRKYWYKYISGQYEREDKECFKLGSLFHIYVLERQKVDEIYYFVDKVDRRTKAGKEQYEKYLEEAKDRILILKDEIEKVKMMYEGIMQIEHMKSILSAGNPEKSVYWQDDDTNVLLKSRPDYITDNYLVDLKTTACANPDKFKHSVKKYGYHRQAAMALDGVSKVTGKEYKHFIIVAVEKEAPYCASAFVLDKETIEEGRIEYKQYAGLYKECLESQCWPSYGKSLQTLSIKE